MIVDNGDMYILVNEDGFPTGVLFVERGFDILKLKDMTITDALIYLDKNNISALYRGCVKGTLRFKQYDSEVEKLQTKKNWKEIVTPKEVKEND